MHVDAYIYPFSVFYNFLHCGYFLIVLIFTPFSCLFWANSVWPKSMVLRFVEIKCLKITLKVRNCSSFTLLRSSDFPRTSFTFLYFLTSLLPYASCFLCHWFKILEMLGRQLSWANIGIKIDTDFKDDGSARRTAITDPLLSLGLLGFIVLNPPIRFCKVRTSNQ